MDDDLTFLAVPVADTPPAGPAGDDGPADVLPFPTPVGHTDPADGFLLRGYDTPGEFFQPRLWAG